MSPQRQLSFNRNLRVVGPASRGGPPVPMGGFVQPKPCGHLGGDRSVAERRYAIGQIAPCLSRPLFTLAPLPASPPAWRSLAAALGCAGGTPSPQAASANAAAPGVAAPPPRVVRVNPQSGGGAAKPPGLAALQAELERGMHNLSAKGKPPPYYIGYEVHDRSETTVMSSYGALVQSTERRTRILDADVRVGDYKLDSTHAIRSSDFDFSSAMAGHPVPLPLSDDETRAAHRRLGRDRSPLRRVGRAAGEAEDPADAEGRRRRSLRRLLARKAGHLLRPAGPADRRRAGLGRPAAAPVGEISGAGRDSRLGRQPAGDQPDALAAQLRGDGHPDRAQLRARLHRGRRPRRGRDGAGAVRELRRRGAGGPRR